MAFNRLYLTADAPTYTPATLRGAWDHTSSSVTRALTTGYPHHGSGSLTTSVIGVTPSNTTWDVLIYRGISGPLAAQTVSGTVDLAIAVLESTASADAYWHVHIYATQGDTDTPRGTLLSNYVESGSNEWTTSLSGLALSSPQTLSSLAVSDGDRLVIEIGLIARQTANPFNATFEYGYLSQVATDLVAGGASQSGHASVIFSASITELVTATRETQVAADALIEPTTKTMRVTQIAADVAYSVTAAELRATQVMVEVLISNPPTGPVYLFPPLTVAM